MFIDIFGFFPHVFSNLLNQARQILNILSYNIQIRNVREKLDLNVGHVLKWHAKCDHCCYEVTSFSEFFHIFCSHFVHDHKRGKRLTK